MRRRAIIGKSKAPAVIPGGFKMQIQTTTANQTFTLPTQSGYTYNATVLWGDGTSSQVTGHNVNNVKTYATAGTYDIEIKGVFESLYFANTGSKLLVKKVLSWGGDDFNGFRNCNQMFNGCTNLNSLAVGGIKYSTAVSDIDVQQIFYECSSLSSIPGDLFKNNQNSRNWSFAFYGCSQLTTLPVGLFDNCTTMALLSNTFGYCSNLSTVPDNLLANNAQLTDLGSVFIDCSKLKLNPNMFGTTPNFGTRIMNFSSCFYRGSFTGTKGTAPALWSATMNASSTKTGCFNGAGNSATSLTNYASIPTAWK